MIFSGGIRRDDISSRNFVFAQDPVTRLFLGRGQRAFAPATESSVTNTNYDVVVKVTSWLDAVANTATNTVGAGGTSYDINNRTFPDQEGLGYELGLRGFCLGDRVILKVNYFNNELPHRVSNPLRDGAIGVEMARQNGYVERPLEGMVLNSYGSRLAGAKTLCGLSGQRPLDRRRVGPHRGRRGRGDTRSHPESAPHAERLLQRLEVERHLKVSPPVV